jgi:ParB family chromosome partitioning protein
MAVTLQQPPKVEMLPLALVRESPSNPRKTFTGIDELAEDVKLRGILQPVLVRAAGSKEYELVFGARRFRAAKAAGMEAIPAFVRALTDEETLEIQLVENSKRADIHPLEEADGYHLLHEKYGHSVDEIAAKVGKSAAPCTSASSAAEAVPAGREAFLAGKLSASTWRWWWRDLAQGRCRRRR